MHRSLLNWGWWDDANTTRLWLYILLAANHRQKEWHGVTINAGQFVTGRTALAEATGLSVQQVRTSLAKLTSTGEITTKSTNKYTVITVVKWADYQILPSVNNQQITNKQPSNNHQITTTKNEKNIRKKEYIYSDAVKMQAPQYILDQINGDLPEEHPATAEEIERIKKIQGLYD